MAAAVNPAIAALTEVLRESLAQSRIMQALDNIIGQTLGLLVDLILLPFMPILIWVLKGLLVEVIAFGKWWNDYFKGDGKDLLAALKTIAGFAGDLIKMAIEFSFKPIGTFIDLGVKFLKWLWGASTGAIDSTIKFAMTASGAVYGLLKWLWGVIVDAGELAMDFLFNIPGAIGGLLNWLWDMARGVAAFVADLSINIPEPVKGLLEWLKDIAGGVISFTLDVISNSAGSARDAAKSLLGSFGIDIPWLAKGGRIAETGVAVVHKGETVVPAGQGGQISVSISGTLFRDEEDMYQRVFDRIRAEMWRQNV